MLHFLSSLCGFFFIYRRVSTGKLWLDVLSLVINLRICLGRKSKYSSHLNTFLYVKKKSNFPALILFVCHHCSKYCLIFILKLDKNLLFSFGFLVGFWVILVIEGRYMAILVQFCLFFLLCFTFKASASESKMFLLACSLNQYLMTALKILTL